MRSPWRPSRRENTPTLARPVGPPASDRLFTGNLGRDTGWLLPVASLTPAIAAILATAAVSLRSPDARRARADGATARGIGLAVVSAGTTAYAVWLVPSQGAHLPGWLGGRTYYCVPTDAP